MNATDFIICCRRLVGAFRQPQGENSRATFFLGFDADGLPFYRAGSFNAGQLTSAFTESLFFCPFCGRRVRGDEGESAVSTHANFGDDGEELTRLALEETCEIETIIAPRVQDTGAGAGAGVFGGRNSRASFN